MVVYKIAVYMMQNLMLLLAFSTSYILLVKAFKSFVNFNTEPLHVCKEGYCTLCVSVCLLPLYVSY